MEEIFTVLLNKYQKLKKMSKTSFLIFNVVLAGIFGLLVMPNLISAEVKEIGDYKYTLEESTYKDYVCDELYGKKFYAV